MDSLDATDAIASLPPIAGFFLVPPPGKWFCALSLKRLSLLLVLTSVSALAAPFLERAEKDVARTLDQARRAEPQLPSPATPRAERTGTRISIQEAVRLALANNNSIVRRREELRVAAMSLNTTKEDYEPQLRNLFSIVRSENASRVDRLRDASQHTGAFQSVGVSQKLPFGGTLSVDATAAETDQGSLTPRLTASLQQPLLRGAGKAYNFEALTQGKRSLVYGLRGFKLLRDDLALDVVTEFLALLDLQRQVANQKEKVAGYEYLVRRSQTFFDLGRESEIELLRMKQEAMLAQTDLLSKQTLLKSRKEFFKLMLNLPPSEPLEFEEFVPAFEPLALDPDEAVKTALASRVDLRTAQEVVDDEGRRRKLAQNDLLPELNLTLAGALGNSSARSSYGVIQEDYSAGLTLSLPFNRSDERFRLYKATLDTVRSERDLQLTRDAIEVGVRNLILQIKRIEDELALQEVIKKVQYQRYRLSVYRFEEGKISNRDVIESNNAWILAENRRLDLLTQHCTGRLRLQAEIGVLDIDQPFLKPATP